MDEEMMLKIQDGMKHCSMKGPGIIFVCNNCGSEFDLGKWKPLGESGIPMWLTIGGGWGFAEEHADCEKEEDDGTQKTERRKKAKAARHARKRST